MYILVGVPNIDNKGGLIWSSQYQYQYIFIDKSATDKDADI